MPIEIKEMHIKINVAEPSKGGGGSGANQEQIIEECMSQVSQMMKNTKER